MSEWSVTLACPHHPPHPSVDPTHFQEDDGNDPIVRKPTPFWLVSLSANGTEITGRPTKLLTNDLAWEGTIIEAPWVVKHAGYYYLFYSGAGGNTYAVGVARAPALAGPYVKHGAPILHTTATMPGKLQGSGHCR